MSGASLSDVDPRCLLLGLEWLTRTWVLVPAAAAAAVAILVAIGRAIARNLPEHLRLDALPDAGVPPAAGLVVAELEALGFETCGPALRAGIRPPAIVVPLVHRSACVHAAVYYVPAPISRTACDFVTVFGDREWAVTTASVVDAGALPPGPRAFLQIVPGVGAVERLQAHAAAVAFVAARGPRGAHLAADAEEFQAMLRAAVSAQRRAFCAAPLRTTLTVLWRAITRRNPHIAPLAMQPDVAAQLDARRGRDDGGLELANRDAAPRWNDAGRQRREQLRH